MAFMKRRKDEVVEQGAAGPTCCECGRAFGRVFDLPSVTVLAVEPLKPGALLEWDLA
jgi:hypothetical protein